MAEPHATLGEPHDAQSGRSRSSASPTRGFLFADLRDYTRYLETHGAAAAAVLLERYRAIVRLAVEAHDGAEIKTEGDSFYVVFPAVSSAVLCGLAIVDAARSGSDDRADPPIPVGIGIHAGETVETADGYVGTAVNIAARICAIARAGEVLVSDTVRALTQTVLPVSFVPRGRRTLKGVTDPVTVFAVARTGDAWARQGLRNRRRPLVVGGLLVSVALLVGLIAWTQLRPSSGLPPGPWTIGLDMPLTGSASGRSGIPIRNAVQLAIDEANAAGGIGGSQLVLDARDDGRDDVPDSQDPTLGVANVTAFIADQRALAMIGPLDIAACLCGDPSHQCRRASPVQPFEHPPEPHEAAQRCAGPAAHPSGTDQLHPDRPCGRHPGIRACLVRLPRPPCPAHARHRRWGFRPRDRRSVQ